MIIRRALFAPFFAFILAAAPLGAGILEDRGIEDAIASSVIFREVLIDRSMVQLYVRYGLVELRGQVADERERELLTYFVAALPDVREVDNRLFIDSPQRQSSDRWRALRMRAFLLTQAGIDATRTRVEFAAGQWQLAGEVGDDASRRTIAQRLHELSPQQPIATALTLSAESPALQPADDASITAMVRSALATSSAPVIEPAVSSRTGHVTLRGFVATSAERDHATRLAAATRGVLSVANELVVRP